MAEDAKRSPYQLRVYVVGAALCAFISVGAPYANVYLQGSLMALDFGTAAAVFLLFLFTLGNTVLRQLHRGLAFDSRELAIIYVMMVVACAIPTMGLMEYLLPAMTSLGYYSTVENEWQVSIQPYVRPWMVVGDDLAIKYFYEGLPDGQAIPWSAWMRPLLAWSPLLLSLYMVMICSAVIIRRQWMDNERLAYPLVQVPLAMIQQDDHRIPPFFRSGLMWAGFALPLVIGSIKGLHSYYPIVPQIVMTASIPVLRNTVILPLMLSFTVVGFSYFVSLEIALGIWLFTLLALLEKGVFGIVGLSSTEMVSVYGTPESPYLAHQGIGAMLVYVVVGLWVARHHLRSVLRKACGRQDELDDSGEMLSYRTATVGFAGGLLVMIIWLWLSGLGLMLTIMFLVVALAIFFGLTKIVVEGGVAAARSPMIASTFAVSGVGSPIVGTQGLVALAYTYVWHGDVRTFVMASTANGLKVAEGLRNQRPLFWAILLAIVVTMIGSGVTILYLAYTYGGINLHTWFFGAGTQVPFEFITNKMNNDSPIQLGGWLFKFIGGGIMVALMMLRHHFLWWPIHPLGFAICTVSFIVGRIWFSVFIAWLLKLLILRYGGAKLHRRLMPLFMGLVLGQISTAGFWLIIDACTGMTGNAIGALFW